MYAKLISNSIRKPPSLNPKLPKPKPYTFTLNHYQHAGRIIYICMHVRTQAAEAKRQSEEERKRKTEEAKRKAAAEEARKAAELKRQQEEDKRKQEEEDERKQEAALNQLAEMGFTDRSGNKKLLAASRNDVAAVVDRLSQGASTAQKGVIQGGRGGEGESGAGSGRGACLEQGRYRLKLVTSWTWKHLSSATVEYRKANL